MTKRLGMQVLMAGAGVAICWAVLSRTVFGPHPGVLPENCERILPGMSVEQVEEIIGGPPRKLIWSADEYGRTVSGVGVWYGKPSERRRGYQRVLVGPTITVHFDDDRRATKAYFAD